MSMLLAILKIIGLVLLSVAAVLLLLILLVLFVPVRYRVVLRRKEQEQNQEGEAVLLHARVRVSWLLHLVRVVVDYPESSVVKLKLLCFTLFRSDKGGKGEKEKRADKKDKENKESQEGAVEKNKTEENSEKSEIENVSKDGGEETESKNGKEPEREEEQERAGFLERVREFFGKILSALKNIQYTFLKICDKIKHIVKSIRHYIEVIQSEAFGNAWRLCSGQVLALLKSIRPRKVRGNLLVGAGDPAATGNIMAVYGMLYPWVGNPKSRYYLALVPDFEQKIIEGNLQIKGKITVLRAVRTAWKIYFNKDVKKLIKMFKKEAA